MCVWGEALSGLMVYSIFVEIRKRCPPCLNGLEKRTWLSNKSPVVLRASRSRMSGFYSWLCLIIVKWFCYAIGFSVLPFSHW